MGRARRERLPWSPAADDPTPRISELQDLAALIRADTPLIVIQTPNEPRILELSRQSLLHVWRVLYRWSITERPAPHRPRQRRRRLAPRAHDLDPDGLDLDALAQASEGFSGAEIERAIVAALYAAHAADAPLSDVTLPAELKQAQRQRLHPSSLLADRLGAMDTPRRPTGQAAARSNEMLMRSPLPA